MPTEDIVDLEVRPYPSSAPHGIIDRMDLDEDRDEIELSVTLSRLEGSENMLRIFRAAVMHDGGTALRPVEYGSISGWIARNFDHEHLLFDADEIDTDALRLAETAGNVIETHPDDDIEAVLLIDRMYLHQTWRGHRLAHYLIIALLDVLQLDPEATIVVLQPEPQRADGGPLDEGPERDDARQRLRAAYRQSGLEPWVEREDDGVWWLPISSATSASEAVSATT